MSMLHLTIGMLQHGDGQLAWTASWTKLDVQDRHLGSIWSSSSSASDVTGVRVRKSAIPSMALTPMSLQLPWSVSAG